MTRDLRARLLDPDAGAEVDPQFDRGFARFGKWLGRDDGTDADVDLQELIEVDGRRGRRARVVHEMHGGVFGC